MSDSKQFDYHSFVEELRILHKSFNSPPANHRTSDSPDFRRWKHELRTLIGQIERKGYEISCRVGHRQFCVKSPYDPVSMSVQREVFDRDLFDTLVEIETIIKRYDSYGDPSEGAAPSNGVNAPQPLAFPEKVTWNWVKEHVPVGWAISSIVALLAIAFSAGVAVGQSSFYKSLITSAEQTVPTATKSTTATPVASALQGASGIPSGIASSPASRQAAHKVP